MTSGEKMIWAAAFVAAMHRTEGNARESVESAAAMVAEARNQERPGWVDDNVLSDLKEMLNDRR
jgi:hypothetical protein